MDNSFTIPRNSMGGCSGRSRKKGDIGHMKYDVKVKDSQKKEGINLLETELTLSQQQRRYIF